MRREILSILLILSDGKYEERFYRMENARRDFIKADLLILL